MTGVALLGSFLSIAQTGTLIMGDDYTIDGHNDYQTYSYQNVATFRINNDFLTNGQELDYRFLTDLNTLQFTYGYNMVDMAILTESENYLAINTKLEISSDNVSWETLDISSQPIINNVVNTAVMWGGMYLSSVSTGDYFSSPTEMLNKYCRITSTIYYKNVTFDTDISTYGFWAGNYYNNYGAMLTSQEFTYETAYANGYQNGYTIGEQAGEKTGYTDGYQDGYQEGQGDTASVSGGLSHLFVEVFNAPINWFSTIFDFNILGINIASLFLGLISVLLMAWLIRRFI